MLSDLVYSVSLPLTALAVKLATTLTSSRGDVRLLVEVTSSMPNCQWSHIVSFINCRGRGTQGCEMMGVMAL
jgi:hypothetical protein